MDNKKSSGRQTEMDVEVLASFPRRNPNPVFAVDQAGRIVYVNNSSRKRFPDLESKGIAHPFLSQWQTLAKALKKSPSGSIVKDIKVERSTFRVTVVYNPDDQVSIVYINDISELIDAESALKESEKRVRAKLDNLLSPEGDIGRLELADIVDAPSIQAIVDDFYAISGIPMGLIDVKGNVIVGAGWADICTRFHRVNKTTQKSCVESDVQLTKGIPAGEFKLYRCNNGMWDVATPVIVGGNHLGSLFSGQFFFDDEPIDRDFFISQANRFGFDIDDYLGALDKVPRVNRDALNLALAFYQKLALSISTLSYSNIMLARSIAERDALTRTVQKNEDRLNRAQKIAHLGSWELDLKKNKLTWSDEVYRIFGLEPGELDVTYEAFIEAVHPDDREAVDEAYASSIREKRDTYEIIHRVVRKGTGEVRFVEERCEHFRDAKGRITSSVGMVQDITERKKSEDFMKAELRMLMEANTSVMVLDDMIKIFLQEAEILSGSNISFYHFVEDDQDTLSLQAWSKNTLDKMCSAEDKGTHHPVSQAGIWADCVREQSPIIHNDYCEAPNRKGMPEGHAPVIRELVMPIMRNSKIVAIFGVGNKKDNYNEADVEILARLGSISWEMINRKRSEEELSRKSTELKAANTELEAFAYSVSHDLRAPLRALDGFSQALLEDYRDKLDETAVDYLNTLRAESQRMATLIDDLLNLSRMTRNEMKRERVNLSLMAKDIIIGLEEADPERQVEVEIAPGLLVSGDKRLVSVALENLFGNAWKFTAHNPEAKIEFGTETENGETTYYIRDNGVGFDMDFVDKLFAPFQRLHQDGEFPGTGIGLATVYRIIHRHGGRVWAEGSPGKGAVFYFTL